MPDRLFDFLREALDRTPHPDEPDLSGFRPASVLVPLHARDREIEFVLVQRSEDLPHHAGQIAFPGGSRDVDEDDLACALREAREEVGLDPSRVRVLGAVEPCITPTGFRIAPFVGRLLVEPSALRPDPREVARIFTLSLGELTAPGVYRRAHLPDGRPLEAFVCRDEVVWGATARILRRVLELALGEAPRSEGPFPWSRLRF
jgi:8-oxo-dGTP pyrophosphatase MutT (NUDIX family)